jgi:hypothetical protein
VNVGVQDEGDIPTAPDHEDAKETLVKMATLWVKIDGLVERSKELFQTWKTQMGGEESTRPEAAASESSASHGSSVNRITINLGGSTLIVVIMLAGIIGACGIVMGLNLAKQDQMDRDFRADKTQKALLERRDIDIETYLMLHGVKIPGDDTHGPTGNLERMKPKEK